MHVTNDPGEGRSAGRGGWLEDPDTPETPAELRCSAGSPAASSGLGVLIVGAILALRGGVEATKMVSSSNSV